MLPLKETCYKVVCFGAFLEAIVFLVHTYYKYYCIYGRNQKRDCFVIVLRTVLQYFVLKLQHKITNCTMQNNKSYYINYKSTNPSTNLTTDLVMYVQ